MEEKESSLSIARWVRINHRITVSDRHDFLTLNNSTPEDAYRIIGGQYPKFFKMDSLCKWAWIGTEYLLRMEGDKFLYDGIDKTKVSVAFATEHGCLEVDKRYLQSVETIASPALFVYTLPNIMLGEVSIRHGFKGSQACFVTDGFDADELHFWVTDAMNNRGIEACLCGFIDVFADTPDVCLFWITREKGEQPFTPAAMQQCYSERNNS